MVHPSVVGAVAAPLATAGADQAVVEAEEEERRRPLADRDRPVVLVSEFEHRRDANRDEGGPVPRLLRHVIGDAEARLLCFCGVLFRLRHHATPLAFALCRVGMGTPALTRLPSRSDADASRSAT